MWHLVRILAASQIWFSDGNPIEAARGGHGVSSRLILDRQGFLDITEVRSPESVALDANGAILWLKRREVDSYFGCPSLQNSQYLLNLSLRVDGGGGFTLGLVKVPDIITACYSISNQVSGRLKPLPHISVEDVAFISKMINQKFVPYQNILDAPSRSIQEIKALGEQFFPFTPYSFELAMCIYDWTTASFTRMVLFKIFQYTHISSEAASLPHPLDHGSLARKIWQSNFSVYTPQDADYMRAFLMQPAHSLDNLTAQLDEVVDQVYKFSEIENRLLTAAMQSMPRTALAAKPRLFSGQVDMQQLGTEHFGIGFRECPLNRGPVGVELAHSLTEALASYASVGQTITTKMAWSFTDNIDDALHYSNGIVLVLNSPPDAWLWDDVSYITPLSDDPGKIEYAVAPGTQFEIRSLHRTATLGKSMTIISLEPVSRQDRPLTVQGIPKKMRSYQSAGPDLAQLVEEGFAPLEVAKLPHGRYKTAGRRCSCRSSSLQFYLMLSFSFSRTVVFGLTLVVALIAIALVALPSSLDFLQPPAVSDPQNSSHNDTDTMASRAAPLVVPALNRHTATVIIVHGLGDSGSGWADAVEVFRRKNRLNEVKFVLPNARIMPITVKSLGPSSTKSLDERARDSDEPGILESRAYLYSLIQQEVSDGISSDRIVLGGFSQGGAMSLFSGLTAPFKLGGIIGLSSWLLLSHKFSEFVPEANHNKETPIFMGHGDRDQLVLYEWGTATEKRLKDLGYDVKMNTYRGMEHSACLEELNDVEEFLVSRLPAKGGA
ncbi:hypothetical protein TARUN_1275 [Trichoderma arundinaceum]|uniref:Acyl-protein thioesterase 1 n=1 Tax=Trichoderma arundinaceum TaxID=490622 RepID=A0A395NXY9_TRIAR|nr:hypothetical protein TARUN_1275 [Trichoderma arundinaceum]